MDETPERAAARAYVAKGPPYWGLSKREDSRLLGRKDGGAGGDFDFKNRKQWYAKTNKTFIAMVRTGKWRPEAAVDVEEVIAVMLAKTTETSVLVEESKKRDAEKKAASIKRQLGVPRDEPALLAHLRDAHDIDDAAIEASSAWPELGPRSEISNARRVERAIRLGIFAPDAIRERATRAKLQ